MSKHNKWILICDESGAKGFNDKPATEGEPIGVVAGLLLPESDVKTIGALIDNAISKYKPKVGKLHVTDLDAQMQEELRKDIFDIIRNHKWIVVYEAISQDGFHDWYNTQAEYWSELKDEAKERGYGYTFSDHKKRLQTTLYLGCFLRALEHFSENEDSPLKLDIDLLMDTMDKPIFEEIEAELKGYLSFQPTQKIETVATRYNFETGKVEKQEGTIEYEIDYPEDQSIGDYSGVNLTVRIDSQFGILADVLSNSISYHLGQSYALDKTIVLSSAEAISKHPLISNIVSLTPEGGHDMNQALYQFPISPEELKSDDIRKPQDFAKNIKFSPKKS